MKVRRRPGSCARCFELRLEERLVDLAVVDRDPLFETYPDHLLPIDLQLCGQLFGRQMVRHVAPFTKKPARPVARAGDDFPGCWCRRESPGPPPRNAHT